jgi:hypothetical protein
METCSTGLHVQYAKQNFQSRLSQSIGICVLKREKIMSEHPPFCILESIDSEGEYSCFARDYDLWCPFATLEGLEKYSCRSGRGIKA